MLNDVLKCPSLPTFPAIATELLELTRDPDVALNDIARLIEADAGLASRVLKTVNSSFYGLSQPCTTLERALGFLGLKAIKSLVLGFSIIKVTKGVKNHTGFDMDSHWRRTIAAATGARQIAVSTRACDPDEAFTAGLFQDMGMLASFVAIRKKYTKVLDSAPEFHSQFPQHEQATLGFTHAQAGAGLAEKWRMSDAVVTSVRFHHAPEEAPPEYRNLVRVVALGRLAAEVVTAEHPAQPMADLMIRANEWFKQGNDSVEALLDQIASAAGELASIMDQKIGNLPDAATILSMANEQLVQQQLETQREAAQLQEKAQTLQAQTVTDALTGAANRKRFDQEIQRHFEQARAQQMPLAVLFIDADKFKAVNDTHGHQAGDIVLVELAKRMMQLVDNLGLVCRYGGEEFAVILPRCNAVKAGRFAELLRKAICGQAFDLSRVDGAPPTLPITASIGVSATDPKQPDRHANPQQLVLEADKAVYEAKEAGRNCVKIFSVEPDSAADPKDKLVGRSDERNEAEAALRRSNKQPTEIKVLLIEDDPMIAKFLRDELARHSGVHVTCTETAGKALQYLRQAINNPHIQPHVILTKPQLHDGLSSDVVKAYQTLQPARAAKVVMLTTGSHQQDPSIAEFESISKQKIVDDLSGWVKTLITSCAKAELAA